MSLGREQCHFHSFSFKYVLLREEKNEDITSILKIVYKAPILCLYHRSMLKPIKDPHFKCRHPINKERSQHSSLSHSHNLNLNVLLKGRIGTKIFCQILNPGFLFEKYGHHGNLLKIQCFLIAM